MMRRRPGPKPVEPLWPHGAIAQMVVVPAELSDTGQTTMGLRKLTVTSATKTAEGWRIVAQSSNKIVRFLDVDEEGIGDNCEPWDDDLERKFGAADPEHNVVLLNNEQPAAAEPPGEVIDIKSKSPVRAESPAEIAARDQAERAAQVPSLPANSVAAAMLRGVARGAGVNPAPRDTELYRQAAKRSQESMRARDKARKAAKAEGQDEAEVREAERHGNA